MAKRYDIVTRFIAALVLMLVYGVSASAILLGGSMTAAQALNGVRGTGVRGAGGRGIGAHGVGVRTSSVARGIRVRGAGCSFNIRSKRSVCPY